MWKEQNVGTTWLSRESRVGKYAAKKVLRAQVKIMLWNSNFIIKTIQCHFKELQKNNNHNHISILERFFWFHFGKGISVDYTLKPGNKLIGCFGSPGKRWSYHKSKHFYSGGITRFQVLSCNDSCNPLNNWEGIIIIPIVQFRKLRHRNVAQLSQGHTVSKV